MAGGVGEGRVVAEKGTRDSLYQIGGVGVSGSKIEYYGRKRKMVRWGDTDRRENNRRGGLVRQNGVVD